jgi:hypothetical protein
LFRVVYASFSLISALKNNEWVRQRFLSLLR